MTSSWESTSVFTHKGSKLSNKFLFLFFFFNHLQRLNFHSQHKGKHDGLLLRAGLELQHISLFGMFVKLLMPLCDASSNQIRYPSRKAHLRFIVSIRMNQQGIFDALCLHFKSLRVSRLNRSWRGSFYVR